MLATAECPSDDLLVSFVSQVASETVSASIRSHLETCAKCRAKVGFVATGDSTARPISDSPTLLPEKPSKGLSFSAVGPGGRPPGGTA